MTPAPPGRGIVLAVAGEVYAAVEAVYAAAAAVEDSSVADLWVKIGRLRAARLAARPLTAAVLRRPSLTPPGELPRHHRLAIANATRAFERGDLASLATINEDIQPLVDAAVAWHFRQAKAAERA